jgi:hypothetical protein
MPLVDDLEGGRLSALHEWHQIFVGEQVEVFGHGRGRAGG